MYEANYTSKKLKFEDIFQSFDTFPMFSPNYYLFLDNFILNTNKIFYIRRN